MKRRGKPKRFWAVADRDNEVLPRTVSCYREDSIQDFCSVHGYTAHDSWGNAKKQGFHLVRVIVKLV